jgi:hypothetical protein
VFPIGLPREKELGWKCIVSIVLSNGKSMHLWIMIFEKHILVDGYGFINSRSPRRSIYVLQNQNDAML